MNTLSRRTFLQSSAALALLGMAGRVRAATPKHCPLSFGTYALPGYSLAEAAQLVSETGFDSIEIATMPGYHGDPDQLSKSQRADIRRLLHDLNLPVGALMGFPIPNPATQAADLQRFEQILELAHDLAPQNPPLIQSILGGGKWDEKKTLFRDTLGPWVEKASAAGIKLCIKPHRSQAMSVPEEAIWLIQQLNAANTLSLVYDQSHYAFRDLPTEDMVAAALPYTGYIVLKDAIQRNGKVTFELPGTAGTIPHAEVLKQFLDGGYQGEICCEVSAQLSKSPEYKPKQATRTCFKNLTSIVHSLDESEYVPMLNGKNLDGWDYQPGSWELRDGEIWCTGHGQAKNWIIWREDQPSDFILRLDFRWDKGNSGVQVRSDDLGDWQVCGSQVEIAQQEVMGLWHHSLLALDHPKKSLRQHMALAGEVVHFNKQGEKTIEQVQDAESVRAQYREHDWNQMEIIAQGPKLIQKINGVTFSTLIDRDTEMSRKRGFIAMQDHGKHCQVAFRNLRIKKLS